MVGRHKPLFLTVFTLVFLFIELDSSSLFKPYSILVFIIAFGLYGLYKMCYLINNGKKTVHWTIVFPSLLFALFMLIGHSLEYRGDFSLLYCNHYGQLAKVAMYFLGYFILSASALSLLYRFLSSPGIRCIQDDQREEGKLFKVLEGYPFRTVFFSLLLLYIPYIIASWPGIFLADEDVQIAQWHIECGKILPRYLRGHLVRSEVFLNTHHPLLHTVLFNWCLDTGLRVFHSGNIGVFILTFTQLLLMICAVSWMCKCLICRYQCPSSVVLCLILYYAFNPRLQNYMMVVSKDVPYSICLLCYLMALHSVLSGNATKLTKATLLLFGIGVFFFRNEGGYILLFSFIVTALFCGKALRIKAMKAFIVIALFMVLINRIIYPFFGISPGSRREALSVPFQQTARYLKKYPEDVSEQEKEAISKILKYKKLAKKYDPERSDPVKGTFNEDASSEDLKQYFQAWLSMLKKHPSVYIEAFLHNYYQYLYPGKILMNRRSYEYSAKHFKIDNKYFASLKLDFHYPPQFDDFRNNYEILREVISKSPLVAPLLSASSYSWLVIVLMMCALYNKSKEAIAFMALPLGILLICFLGPCNGFFCRYTYPLIVIAPYLVLSSCHLLKEKSARL